MFEKIKRLDFFLPAMAISGAWVTPAAVVFIKNRNSFALNFFLGWALIIGSYLLLTVLWSSLLYLCRNKKFYPLLYILLPAWAVSCMLQYSLGDDLYLEYDFVDTGNLYYWIMCIVHFCILAVPFGAALYWGKWCLKNNTRLSALIIMCQLVLLPQAGYEMRSNINEYDFLEYSFDESGKFTFAGEDNVIVIVVDCMGRQLGLELLKNYPEIRSLLKDFTCFDRMQSPLPSTVYAVPAMLCGMNFPRTDDRKPDENYDHAEYLNKACRREGSVFAAARQKNWRVEGYPYILQSICYAPDVIDNSVPVGLQQHRQSAVKLIDIVADKLVPGFVQQCFSWQKTTPFVVPTVLKKGEDNEPYDLRFYRRLQNEFKSSTTPGMFKYLHLQGAHGPMATDENLTPDRNVLKLQQLRGSWKNIELLLQKLKSSDLYDRACIVISGDHSELYTPEIVTFIKPPRARQQQMVFNSADCQLADVAGTICRIAGLNEESESIFERTSSRPSQDIEPAEESNVLLAQWQLADKIDRSCSASAFGSGRLFRNGKLWIEPGTELRQYGKKIDLFAENIQSGATWVCRAAEPDDFRYMIVDFNLLPDGIYRLELCTRPDSQDGENALFRREYIPDFLSCKDGNARFLQKLPALPGRALQPGESITFEAMKYIPQFINAEKNIAEGSHMKLYEDCKIGLRLPVSERNLRLEIRGSYSMRGAPEGYCSIYLNGHEAASSRLDPAHPGRFMTYGDLPIPADAIRNGFVEISFRFNSPLKEFSGRDKFHFRINELKLAADGQ